MAYVVEKRRREVAARRLVASAVEIAKTVTSPHLPLDDHVTPKMIRKRRQAAGDSRYHRFTACVLANTVENSGVSSSRSDERAASAFDTAQKRQHCHIGRWMIT
jgi:hypothetical protein